MGKKKDKKKRRKLESEEGEKGTMTEKVSKRVEEMRWGKEVIRKEEKGEYEREKAGGEG